MSRAHEIPAVLRILLAPLAATGLATVASGALGPEARVDPVIAGIVIGGTLMTALLCGMFLRAWYREQPPTRWRTTIGIVSTALGFAVAFGIVVWGATR